MKGLVVGIAALVAVFSLNAALYSFLGNPPLLPDPAVQAATQEKGNPTPQPVPVQNAVEPPRSVDLTRQALRELPAALSAASTVPSLCSLDLPRAWSVYATTPDSYKLAVLITPAGQGQQVFSRALSTLYQCQDAQVYSQPGEIRAYFPAADATWVLLNYHDIIISAFAPDDPSTRAAELLSHLKPYCSGDPSSSQNNPLFPDYEPYAPTVEVGVPTPVFPSYQPVSVPSSDKVKAVRVPRPDLALFLEPTVDLNPQSSPLPPRGRSPLVADPLTVPVPDFARPSPLPQAQDRPESMLSVALPTPSRKGPGCGWEFSASTAPAPDPQIDQLARSALVNALSASIDSSAQWLNRTWADEVFREQDQESARAQSAWDAYDTAVARAESEVDQARARFEQSRTRWYGWAEPAPLVPQEPLAPLEPPISEEGLS